MTARSLHRLDGLEPDNLLAFLALLGLMRALEHTRPGWHPRALWTVDESPLCPALRLREAADEAAVLAAAAEGVNGLSEVHAFDGLSKLDLSPEDAARRLREAAANASGGREAADLWSALVSAAAVSRDGRKAEPTPLCLMFGNGRQYFLSRLEAVPKERTPPERSTGRGSKVRVSETECLREALFAPWQRPDPTHSFRWDPNEDVRHALRWKAPTDDPEPTQHGANRLAAVGLPLLTVVPVRRSGDVRLALAGGAYAANRDFTFGWPIWRAPTSLAGIRALLAHPRLDRPETRAALGIVEHRRARRINVGKFMNFTCANP